MSSGCNFLVIGILIIGIEPCDDDVESGYELDETGRARMLSLPDVLLFLYCDSLWCVEVTQFDYDLIVFGKNP